MEFDGDGIKSLCPSVRKPGGQFGDPDMSTQYIMINDLTFQLKMRENSLMVLFLHLFCPGTCGTFWRYFFSG